jgi:hypothetical protein
MTLHVHDPDPIGALEEAVQRVVTELLAVADAEERMALTIGVWETIAQNLAPSFGATYGGTRMTFHDPETGREVGPSYGPGRRH